MKVENLPQKFLSLKRFFPVGETKGDVPLAWSKPENQMTVADAAQRGVNIGFDTCGHDVGEDYLFLDFDHVLDDNGNFINEDAEKWYTYITLSFDFAYCERSISGHGLHIFALPTSGKFGKISPAPKNNQGVLIFDEQANCKLEIFYKSGGRYCLLTGDLYNCEPNATIPRGEIVDEVLENILREIERRNPARQLEVKPVTRREGLSPEIQSLVDKINKLKLADFITKGYLRHSEKGAPEPNGYVCPWCGSGTHEHKTGALTYYGADPHFTCHARGCGGDILNFLSQIYGVDNHGKDFFALVRQAADDFNLPYDPEIFIPKKQQEPAQDVSKSDDTLTHEQELALFSGDLSDADFARRLHFMYPTEFRYIQIDNRWFINRRNNHGGGLFEDAGEQSSAVGKFAVKLVHTLTVNVGAEPVPPPIIISADETVTTKETDKNAQEQYKRDMKNYKYRQAVAQHLKKTKNISQAVTMLKNFPQLTIRYEDLNRNKNLLNVLNGVVDLQTGKFTEYRADYYFTRQANAIYDPHADTQFVEKVLADILPDDDTRHAVKRYLGYCLTGEKNYHVSEMWQGNGRNGKSTIIDVIMKLAGTYAKKLPPAALLENKRPADGNSATPAISQLADDVRLAIIDELPRNCRIDAATFKTITGDDTAYSRPLFCNPRLVELRAKLILNGNHLPNFDVDDVGMLCRINRVPFTQRFTGVRADPNLPAKLSTPENLSALLKIFVDEAVAYYRDGLLESDEMVAALQSYIDENDFVRNFLVENCITGQGGEIYRKALEDRLREAYPRECSRLKKKELLDMLINRLEPHGAYYDQDRTKKNVFKNIRWLDETN